MQIKPLDNEELTRNLVKSAMDKNVEEVNFLIRKGANASDALAGIFLLSLIIRNPTVTQGSWQEDAINLLISKGADKNIALALVASKEIASAVDTLVNKGADKSMALAIALERGDLKGVRLLIEKGADKGKALAIVALKADVAAVDLLIGKGADKSKALAMVVSNADMAAVDLLISKGADIQKAIASIEKASSLFFTEEFKIAAVNLLTNKAHEKSESEKAGAALLELAKISGDSAAEESKDESVPSTEGDQGPDGGSSSVVYVGTKRSRLESEEDEEDIVISYSSAQSSSSNPNKAAKTDNTVSARSKGVSSNSESSSSSNQHSDVQQNEQEEGQKELIPSGVLAPSLLKDALPVFNSFTSEGDHASEALTHLLLKDHISGYNPWESEGDYTGKALTREALKGNAIRFSIDLANAALRGDEAGMDLSINNGANKERALVRAASNGKKEAIDLLMARGADKNIAFTILASKGNVKAMDLLRSKGASNEKALAIIEKIPNKMLSQKGKIAAKNLLTNAHKEIESASDSGDDLVSVSENENDHAPDGGSSGAIRIGVKRSRLENEEDQEEAAISYSGNQSGSSSSNKATKSDSAVSAGSKRASLNEESNSSKDQHSDVQLEIKTKLEDQIIYKSLEERDLEEAEKEAELVASNENQNIISLSKNIREDLFDHQYLLEKAAEKQVKIYETQEISQLYQFGKWVYGLIENAVNSPLVFTDKSGGLGAYSLSYDDGLPKIDMDSASTFYMNEAL